MVHVAGFWMFCLLVCSTWQLLYVSWFLLPSVLCLSLSSFALLLYHAEQSQKGLYYKNNQNKGSKYHGTNTFLSKLLPTRSSFRTLTISSLCFLVSLHCEVLAARTLIYCVFYVAYLALRTATVEIVINNICDWYFDMLYSRLLPCIFWL